jgi:hypothetical protein
MPSKDMSFGESFGQLISSSIRIEAKLDVLLAEHARVLAIANNTTPEDEARLLNETVNDLIAIELKARGFSGG